MWNLKREDERLGMRKWECGIRNLKREGGSRDGKL
jgi:hypothetical protein